MDFRYFDRLSPPEAREFLANFLEIEGRECSRMLVAARDAGIDAEVSTDSLTPVFEWLVAQVEIVPRESDQAIPDWIRSTPSYARDLFSFTPESATLIVRFAYFLGAVLIKRYPELRWEIGDAETAVKNMPVVTGFRNNLELAAILAAENLFLRAVADGVSPAREIDGAVSFWTSHVAA